VGGGGGTGADMLKVGGDGVSGVQGRHKDDYGKRQEAQL